MAERSSDEPSDDSSIAPSEQSFGGRSGFSFVSQNGRPRYISAIRGQETFAPRERFTLYKVEVNNGERTWVVYRRYSDFVLLNKKLKKLFPGFVLTLPPKRVFRNNFDRQFITKRQKGLESFLKTLFELQDVMESDPVRRFFRLDNPPGPHEDLTASKDYCETLESTVSRLKKEMDDQDIEMSHLRSELRRVELYGPNQNGSNCEGTLTEKILQQKLIAAEEMCNQARQEIERMKIDISAEKALELSTRQTESQQRELQVRDLLKEFSANQMKEDQSLQKMAEAFGNLANVNINVGGKCIDVRTIDGVSEREEELKNALHRSRTNLENLQKQQLENLKKVIEDLNADLVRAKYKLESSQNEANMLREALANAHSNNNEEMIKRDTIIHNNEDRVQASRRHIDYIEQKYFYSLLLGVKLNLCLWGKTVNGVNLMKPDVLFVKVKQNGIALDDWPRWISGQFSKLVE